MDLNGITANDPFPTALGGATRSGQEIDTGAFLELFVAQLENQDPLEPVKNEQFVEQLATISSLDELEQMNGNLVSMMALNQSNALLSQLTQSSALIGKVVQWLDPSTGAASSGSVERVKIQDGLALLRVDGRDVPLAFVSEILGDAAAAGAESEEAGTGTSGEESETNEE